MRARAVKAPPECKRLVLSRKGFDSSYGGCPSPILPDGTLVSLPIPERRGSRTYAELCCVAGSVGTIVTELTGGRITGADRGHLDPDLDARTCKRNPGWVPAFGQDGTAARHLDRQSVGVGDLFLFFGWFRQAERVGGILRFAKNAPNVHVLFGWLEVGRILRQPQGGIEQHPHFLQQYEYSRVYAAATVRNGGIFRTFSDKLQLTRAGKNRSEWSLPEFFMPEGRTPLTYHGSQKRWRRSRGRALLSVVARGQEFVLPVARYPEALEWAREIGARAS